MIELLKEEEINSSLIQGIVDFRASHSIKEEERGRIPVSRYLYYGRKVWEQTTTALLYGQDLFLAEPKVTGKSILAQNLAAAFGRPVWNVSLHVNMDASGLIGTDTFQNGAVVFRPRPVYRRGISGSSGVLNGINMARDEALTVFHGISDFRWTIDVPGYDVVHMNGGIRFTAAMSYGYASTRKLNEALTSRFAYLQMPATSREDLEKLMSREYSGPKRTYARQFVQPFLDMDRKCQSVQLSTHPLDLRGLLDAVRLTEKGLGTEVTLDMRLADKSFDSYEQNLMWDLTRVRIPKELEREKLFTD